MGGGRVVAYSVSNNNDNYRLEETLINILLTSIMVADT